MRYLTPLFVLFLFLASCTSVEDLVESGDYERTIRLAQKRLTGKEKKNPRYVLALERAVNKANQRDMSQARTFSRPGSADWVRVHGIYEKISRRQNALRPLLPLMDKNGRRAQIKLIDLNARIAESEAKAAEQLYEEAARSLVQGRLGNKQAARDAYRDLTSIDRYRSNYRDTDALRQEARELGQVYIYVTTVNESRSYLPAGFEAELLRLNARNLDDEWRRYDFEVRPQFNYDYDAQIVIRDVRVSPETLNERVYVDERNIRDGDEYVLDANGNVAKDTLGNDITRPRTITVRAEVLETGLAKSALVTASLLLYDNREDRIVDEQELTAEANFSNFTYTFRGDERALSRDTRRALRNPRARFPNDETLVLDAADILKLELQELLARSWRTI